MRPVLPRSVRREGTAELPPAEEIEAGLDIAMLSEAIGGPLEVDSDTVTVASL